jgi:hypothetical protein
MKMQVKLFLLMAPLVALMGCPAKKPPAEAAPTNGRVMIADVNTITGNACPLCSRPLFACAVEPRGPDAFSDALGSVFYAKGFEIVKGRVPASSAGGNPTVAQYLELANKLNAKYLVAPELYCWRERKGNAAAASEPAEVGFHLHIFDPATGKETWGGDFHEQQQPLNENILAIGQFAKRGGKWITADELAREGIEKLIDQFLKARENAANPGN